MTIFIPGWMFWLFGSIAFFFLLFSAAVGIYTLVMLYGGKFWS